MLYESYALRVIWALNRNILYDSLEAVKNIHNIFEEIDLESFDIEVQQIIDDAITFADESEEPEMSSLYNNIYEKI